MVIRFVQKREIGHWDTPNQVIKLSNYLKKYFGMKNVKQISSHDTPNTFDFFIKGRVSEADKQEILMDLYTSTELENFSIGIIKN